MSEDVVDHEARRQIIQLSNEQGRITATLESLMRRMDRESKATERALNSHANAMDALTTKIAETRVHTAFSEGQNVSRWTVLGAGILGIFTFIGGVAVYILQRVFP